MSESLQTSLQVTWPDYTTDEEDEIMEFWELTLGDDAVHLYHTDTRLHPSVESRDSTPK